MKSVAVIGGGPAGLAAAIAAVCAGLRATIIAPNFGGRFYESPRIENILGFPLGVSGAVFAERAIEQAHRLGVDFVAGKAEAITTISGEQYVLAAIEGREEDVDLLPADAVVLATGMKMTEGQWHRPSTVQPGEVAVVVGAGDAAGQVALGHASKGEPTVMVVRGDNLNSLSPYLRARVEQEPNITIHHNCEVVGCEDSTVHTTAESFRASCVEMLVGASVDVGWANVSTDDRGFVETDTQFQTSRPNVYAIGDVRAGSIKRVNVAAGEGTAVGFIIARALGVM